MNNAYLKRALLTGVAVSGIGILTNTSLSSGPAHADVINKNNVVKIESPAAVNSQESQSINTKPSAKVAVEISKQSVGQKQQTDAVVKSTATVTTKMDAQTDNQSVKEPGAVSSTSANMENETEKAPQVKHHLTKRAKVVKAAQQKVPAKKKITKKKASKKVTPKKKTTKKAPAKKKITKKKTSKKVTSKKKVPAKKVTPKKKAPVKKAPVAVDGTLAAYDAKKFRIVNNAKTTVDVNYKYAAAPNYERMNSFENEPNIINSLRNVNGEKVQLKTKYFLPVSYQKSGDWGNPQALVIDGSTYYTVISNDDNTGYLVRYDMQNLDKYINANFAENERLSALRTIFSGHQHYITGDITKKSTLNNQRFNEISPYIKISAKMTIGHGQAFAMNPKDHSLWLMQDTDAKAAGKTPTTMVRINQSSLKVDKTVKFKLKDTVPMGHNLTFDKNGNAYFYTTAASGTGDKSVGWDTGTVKIYKGQFGNGPTKWSLVMQGLRYKAGTKLQSFAYNPRANTLVFISDSSILSVPVSKLGKLTPADVRATTFDTQREFEGMPFDSEGYANLLAHRGSEILRSTKPY